MRLGKHHSHINTMPLSAKHHTSIKLDLHAFTKKHNEHRLWCWFLAQTSITFQLELQERGRAAHDVWERSENYEMQVGDASRTPSVVYLDCDARDSL